MLDVWIVRLRIWSPGCCGCVLAPHVSPNSECVRFFSCVTKSGFSCFLFLVTVLCSFRCVWLWRLLAGLSWFGSLRFTCVRVSLEPVGSGPGVVAGRQAVLVGLAVWLVDVYSVGHARVWPQQFSLAAILKSTLCDVQHLTKICCG